MPDDRRDQFRLVSTGKNSTATRLDPDEPCDAARDYPHCVAVDQTAAVWRVSPSAPFLASASDLVLSILSIEYLVRARLRPSG